MPSNHGLPADGHRRFLIVLRIFFLPQQFSFRMPRADKSMPVLLGRARAELPRGFVPLYLWALVAGISPSV